MTTTPADLPNSIEDLRALLFLQAEEHEEEKQQLELKVAEQEHAIAKQEQTVSEYSEEISHNAKQKVETHYRWQRYMENLLTIFREDFGYRQSTAHRSTG